MNGIFDEMSQIVGMDSSITPSLSLAGTKTAPIEPIVPIVPVVTPTEPIAETGKTAPELAGGSGEFATIPTPSVGGETAPEEEDPTKSTTTCCQKVKGFMAENKQYIITGLISVTAIIAASLIVKRITKK